METIYALINGERFPLASPIFFGDEANTKLDSCVISIPHIVGRLNLFHNEIVIIRNNDTNTNDFTVNKIYKVYLIDTFNELTVSLKDNYYNYKLNLMSLAKALEYNPNPTTISIKQPLSGTKHTVVEELERINDIMSPLIKLRKTEVKWQYGKMFTISQRVKALFGSMVCPEFRFNTATYREILTEIFAIKRVIPKVNNDFSIDYTEVNPSILPTFNYRANEGSYINRHIDSGDDSTGLLANITNCISESDNAVDTTSNCCEYVGFRSYEAPIMSSSNNNLSLHTTHKINKINSIKLCVMGNTSYYSAVAGALSLDNAHKWLEIDITPLCVLNKVRNTLVYNDTNADFVANEDIATRIAKMAQYQQYTFTYSLGGNTLTGFGSKIQNDIITNTVVIQNIINKAINDNCKIGTVIASADIADTPNAVYEYDERLSGITCPNYSDFLFTEDDIYSRLVFKIDYQTQGSLSFTAHKKVYNNLALEKTTYDNQHGSMVNSVRVGDNEYSKVERIGNDIYQITQRATSLALINEVPSLFNNEIVIYSRELNVYNNQIVCLYKGQLLNNYINYFTDINARNRAWQLAEDYYDRSEVDNYYIELSHKAKPSTQENNNLNINLVSLVESSLLINYNRYYEPINYVYSASSSSSINGDILDLDKKVLGRSIVYTYSYYDNVIAGVNIKNSVYTIGGYAMNYELYGDTNGERANVVSFFTNRINYLALDTTYKYLPNDKVYFGTEYSDFTQTFNNKVKELPRPIIAPIVYPDTNFCMPSAIMTQKNIQKDNAERICLSTQFEYCADSEDIIIYSNFIKHNALVRDTELYDYLIDNVSTIYSADTLLSMASASISEDTGTMVLATRNGGYFIASVGLRSGAKKWVIDYNAIPATSIFALCDRDLVGSVRQYYKIENSLFTLIPNTLVKPSTYTIGYRIDKLFSESADITPIVIQNASYRVFYSANYPNCVGLTITIPNTIVSSQIINLCILDNNSKPLLAFNNVEQNATNTYTYYFSYRKNRSDLVYDDNRANLEPIGTISNNVSDNFETM